MQRLGITAACGAWVAAFLPLAAVAATHVSPVVSPDTVSAFRTEALSDLAHSRANLDALAALKSARPGAVLFHRMPDGRSTAAASLARAGSPLPRLASARTTPVTSYTSASYTIGGFTGIYEGSQSIANNGAELEPPDQGMAVNRGVVGVVNNNAIQFFQNGAALESAVATSVFFNAPSTVNLSDPHILYDPSVGRWFVDELVYNGNNINGFYLAVSTTNNPLGGYHVYRIPAFSTGLSGCYNKCLPDYPQVGFDANGFYIDADLFGPFTFVEAAIYAMPKAALVSGQSFTTTRFDLQDFVVQPSVTAPGESFVFANGGTEYFLSARNIFDLTTNVRVFALTNTAKLATVPSTVSLQYVDVPVESYTGTVPSTQPNQVGPLGMSVGATASPQLDGGYNSFGANIKLAKGLLYGALTTGSADSTGLPRDNIAWFAMAPTISGGVLSATVAYQGYVVPPDGYSLSYPDLALTDKATGIMGFTITNPDPTAVGGYPSGAIVQFRNNSTGNSIIVSGQGAATDDGFTGYAAFGGAGVGRWGDYGAASVDAATGYLYTANEYIPDTNVYPRGFYANWGTFITQLVP